MAGTLVLQFGTITDIQVSPVIWILAFTQGWQLRLVPLTVTIKIPLPKQHYGEQKPMFSLL